MKFEPQCKKQSDLHRELARVLDMCEGFAKESFYPLSLDCVRYKGSVPPHHDGLPQLYMEEIDKYEFALAIVEGKPVFRGDVLYVNGTKFTVGEMHDPFLCEAGYSYRGYGTSQRPESCTWNPPRRTITINGVEVKAPDEIRAKVDNCYLYPNEITIRFKNVKDAEVFKAALEGKQP